jgi:perosamine synthetase
MPALVQLANEHGLKIVEDCAEALGSSLHGTHVGAFGDIGTFSFFGNTTVTTGEGGMVVARDAALVARMRKVKGQGQSPERRYWHDELGFNYRMTNICAAIGVAQMERVGQIIELKRKIGLSYRAALRDSGVAFQSPREGLVSSDWLVSVLLPPGTDRDGVIERLAARNLDSRPVFSCAHQMPMHFTGNSHPVAEDIARRGISLPSFPALTDEQVAEISRGLLAAI